VHQFLKTSISITVVVIVLCFNQIKVAFSLIYDARTTYVAPFLTTVLAEEDVNSSLLCILYKKRDTLF